MTNRPCANHASCKILICAAKRSCEILGECLFDHELSQGSFNELMKGGRKGVAKNVLPLFKKKKPFKYHLPKQHRIKRRFNSCIKKMLAKPEDKLPVKPAKVYPKNLKDVMRKWQEEPDPNFHESDAQ